MLYRILTSIMIMSLFSPIVCFGQLQLDFNKDLFPEGIAIDPIGKRLFLNSLKYDKIVTCNLDGTAPKDFIESGEHNYLSGFGMTVKEDTLYALGNELVRPNNKSVLLLLNVDTGDLIDKYEYQTSDRTYFNDLAISANNEIFITDSESNKVFRIKRPKKEIEVFLQSDEITRSNGIVISPDSDLLYLATINGIRIVDIETKKILNTPNKQNLGIDGLKCFDNLLIGIVNVWESKPENNGIFRYFLNNAGNRIIGKERILSFSKEYKTPTTFDLVGKQLFFVMNTQLDNFDERSKSAKDTALLKAYRLMEIGLQ